MMQPERNMATSSKKSINSIVEDAMPGWQTISSASDALPGRVEASAPAEQVGKDAPALRSAYRKAAIAPAPDAVEPEGADVKFVRVTSKTPTDADVGAKTVVVDVKAGKVLGVQG
jgi:hypothetical protein